MAGLSCLPTVLASLVSAITLVVGGLGLAVRQGLANEVLFWFPLGGKADSARWP